MKVLFCNKYFFPKGGSELVMLDTARLLEEHGHQVAFFAMHHPLNLPSEYSPFFVSQVDYSSRLNLCQKVKAAARVLYSLEARKKIRALIAREKPDVVHLHNIYHQLSPSIIAEIARHRLPMVMTVHDYKLVCPAILSLRHGKVCGLCARGRYYHCLVHRCTHGSLAQSLVNTLEMYLHHRILHIYEKIHVFIAPSLYLKSKLEEMGFPGKIVWLPNFVRVAEFRPAFGTEDHSLVYFGRLSTEKGVATLIRAVAGLPVPLKIIGDGPQRPELERLVHRLGLENVHFLGYLLGEALHQEIQKSFLVVVPSEWPENNPRTVLESYALGKPVLGARIGGIPELVREGETGLTFEPGSVAELREKILSFLQYPALALNMGEKARLLVEKKYSVESHYLRLLEIYNCALYFKKD